MTHKKKANIMPRDLFWIIIGNILICIGYLLDFYFGYKYNKKDIILKGNIISISLTILANFSLGATAAIITSSVTLFRIITIYIKDKYNKKFWIPFIIICILYFVSLKEYKGFETILLVVCMFCSFLPKWFSKNVQYLRFGGLFANTLIIPYNISTYNYTGCIFAIFSAITILISIIKWYLVERKHTFRNDLVL